MSFAASKLKLESPTAELADPFASTSVLNHEAEIEADALEKLLDLPSTVAGPVIAIDLDDVLSQTNQVVAECKSIKTMPLLPRSILLPKGITKYMEPRWRSPTFTVSRRQEFMHRSSR